ncbi:arginine transporter [Antarctobacter jejuensis]|uniref:arginine transporter n=1 Tax=Antarctobacter jejuensis TaxID=1439938 RepID=UPI003FCF7269
MKQAIMMAACLALVACGGGNSRTDRGYTAGSRVLMASGPVSDACLRAGRSAASRQRCGCVQAVANRDLSASDQRLAVTFFADPHRAQEIRQSDNPRHEAFWQRYKAFAARAETLCRGT